MPPCAITYSPPPCGEGLGVGVSSRKRLTRGSTPPARLRRAALPVKGRAARRTVYARVEMTEVKKQRRPKL